MDPTDLTKRVPITAGNGHGITGGAEDEPRRTTTLVLYIKEEQDLDLRREVRVAFSERSERKF